MLNSRSRPHLGQRGQLDLGRSAAVDPNCTGIPEKWGQGSHLTIQQSGEAFHRGLLGGVCLQALFVTFDARGHDGVVPQPHRCRQFRQLHAAHPPAQIQHHLPAAVPVSVAKGIPLLALDFLHRGNHCRKSRSLLLHQPFGPPLFLLIPTNMQRKRFCFFEMRLASITPSVIVVADDTQIRLPRNGAAVQ